MAIQDVFVPDIGDFSDVPVIEVQVAVGDSVDAEQALITLESDKATMEVPAPFAGVVKEVVVNIGDSVSEGTLIVKMEAAGESAAPASPEPVAEAAPAPVAQAGGAVEDVFVPDIGDFSDVPVIEVQVAVGDSVEAEQPLITLESDKATMEVPSPSAGVVKEVVVSIGDTVSEGSLIVKLELAGGASAAAPVAQESVPVAAAPAASGSEEVTVPDIGDFSDVPVIEVQVAVGDSFEAEQPLITLESDKATMEVPAPFAGTVKELKVSIGDTVSQGSLILVAETSGGSAAAPVASVPEVATAEPAPVATPSVAVAVSDPNSKRAQLREPQHAPIAQPSTQPKSAKVHAGPAVRKLARELGVDLGQVTGSGRKGRILKDDVKAFVKTTLTQGVPAAATQTAAPAPSGGMGIPEIPEVDFSKFGEVETQPMGRIKKLSGPHLHRAWLNIPHVTQFDEADITELEAFRKGLKAEAEKHGVKVTMLAFLLKASVAALKEYPNFNASLDKSKENLVLKKYYNIGVAVDTPNGLVVPVIKDVNLKGLFDIARELGEISKKARDGKLSPSEMQGGTFTISSLGGIGGTQFTPIVNAPEVAILGVSRSSIQPVYEDGEFVPRLIMPFSVSYDHRVIDGAAGARFTQYLSFILSDVRRLLL
ncbi:dihydrolipoyllysine-residue acetyltransferase [Candidatus Albibeggiatoa sp. nov. NOAA]|uniref:dihydrolipoyllysine-residue acetyltransferase n=1 Tax=Candidatus Albibeggiatoa sp. nov. NOAA TaxID=3162724 RepID=UPI0032FB5E14|nr:dihydrolipoyllysine-residue acetyltransferase [Thiotrichaceae bacterium]